MKNHINSIIIGACIVITAVLLSGAWVKSHLNDSNKTTIRVTGKADRNFTSDLIVWNGSFSKKSENLSDAYQLVKKDQDVVNAYLQQKGVKEDEIKFSSITIDKKFESIYNDKGYIVQTIFKGYELTQNVSIESKEVDKVEQISREVTELINQGVEFYSSEPSYFSTKLSDIKIELLKAATEDARKRAETITQSAGSGLSNLVQSYMGVFQITAQNSNEDYEYGGSYNTTSKEKTISITVTLEYDLR